VSKPFAPQPVKLIMSLLSADSTLIEMVDSELEARFGVIDFRSEALPFHFTDYYEAELGKHLLRRMVSFDKLINPDALPSIKIATNALEDAHADERGRRRVNIDPGYISLAHLILATCKGFAHRPYLRDGVYADLTLIFRAQSFQALEWTFPDYRSHEMLRVLNTMRKNYRAQISTQKTAVITDDKLQEQ
jgi:hypothetical protein